VGDWLLLKAWGRGRQFDMGRLRNPGRRTGCWNGPIKTSDFGRRLWLVEAASCTRRAAAVMSRHRAGWYFNCEEALRCRFVPYAAESDGPRKLSL